MDTGFSRIAVCLALTWWALIGWSSVTQAHDPRSWFGTWETSPAGLPTITKIGPYPLPPRITIQGTIRYRLRITAGGSQIQLRLSNEYAETPLKLGAVSVGLAEHALDAVPGSLKRVTFGGEATMTIPAGAPVLSDPIEMPVKALSDLVVSVYLPEGVSAATCRAQATAVDPAAVDGADATLLEHLPSSTCVSDRPIVSAVVALAAHSHKVVVALGDSITDGFVDPATGERGWPGALARRLQRQGISVVNAGIGGNRLLKTFSMFGASALSRFDRDVLAVPGLSHLIVLEGINDIGMSGAGGLVGDSPLVEPEEMIAAYSQLIARAHAHGIKVFGATILPFAIAFDEPGVYYSQDKERIRTAVNSWIRTSKAFDGIIDFDAAVRDASRPGSLKKEYDSGDHLHPNAAGYRAMGDAIDLKLFR